MISRKRRVRDSPYHASTGNDVTETVSETPTRFTVAEYLPEKTNSNGLRLQLTVLCGVGFLCQLVHDKAWRHSTWWNGSIPLPDEGTC